MTAEDNKEPTIELNLILMKSNEDKVIILLFI